MKLPTFSDTRTETPSFALFALGKESHPPAGARSSVQEQHRNWAQFVRRRRSNEKTQTWKKQSGSVGHRARLYGNELWLRSRWRQAGHDLTDSSGIRTRCYILRYR